MYAPSLWLKNSEEETGEAFSVRRSEFDVLGSMHTVLCQDPLAAALSDAPLEPRRTAELRPAAFYLKMTFLSSHTLTNGVASPYNSATIAAG